MRKAVFLAIITNFLFLTCLSASAGHLNPCYPDTGEKKNGMCEMFDSDNDVTTYVYVYVYAQQRKSSSLSSSSSGKGGIFIPPSFTVSFDTDGGSFVEPILVESGDTVSEPSTPKKAGHVFDGWYSDKNLRTKYDFSSPVTAKTTIYAKWNRIVTQNDEIIFTVGEKHAIVFGRNVTYDAAPIIENNRSFLPARFAAEALGAEVLWDENARTVTVTKDETEIVITIDSETALVNGKAVSIDAPAFIRDDRTYTPVRFVCENLGAAVKWSEGDRSITVIKQNTEK